MKQFLKIGLLVILALIAVKLLPLTFGLGFVLAGAMVALLALVASAVATLFAAMVGLAAVLAPLWIPILIVVGVIALIKRCTRNSRVVAT